ncbi:MAG: NADPH-dependent glutamate synthase [Endomicrobiales bacterium]
MSERLPSERSKNFGEVSDGYTREQAVQEARRCLQCKIPSCITGCPVEIDIPGFIEQIALNDPQKAISVLREKSTLPGVCGRVCPQEDQCEKHCILANKGIPIAIGALERYAADWEREHIPAPMHIPAETLPADKIAIIGSGPAGLTCAGDLAQKGFSVTIFESLHAAGGVLCYGIPEFRLPRTVVYQELETLKQQGVVFEFNCLVGRTKSIPDLLAEGFKAIFIGTGAGLPSFLNVPGENLNNIFSANEFLVRVNLMNANRFPKFDTPVYVGKNIAVIGGGNVAMDAARTALRLGAATVTIIYRRTEAEMPARAAEIHHAREEGIRFQFLTAPVQFIGDEKRAVQSIECISMELGAPDDTGRRRPQPVPNSNFSIAADMVVVAIGSNPNPVLPSLTAGLQINKAGHIKVDSTFMTSLPGVFAGGDIVSGETVIQAMGMGKQAARCICDYLTEKKE